MNLSRAIGPAIGGALYAASSAAAVFLVNALSFVPVIGAVARWRGRSRTAGTAPPEHVVTAVRAGARYVAASPALRVILQRAGFFMFLRKLDLGAAAAGREQAPASRLWWLRAPARWRGHRSGRRRRGAPAPARAHDSGALMTGSTLVFACTTLALAYVRVSALAALALVIGGVAWILVLSTLNSQYQSTLPGWAKARGMSYYLVIFQGGGALGSAAFGVIAQHAGLTEVLLAAAAGLALVALAGVWLPFKAISPHDLLPAGDWPDPQPVGATGQDGPVLVTPEYRPKAGLERDLVDALYAGRHAQRRTGAVSWRVWRDAADPRHP